MTTVQSAVDTHKAILNNLKISKKLPEDFDGAVFLKFMNDPYAWLPIWMLKSEVVSMVLFDKRLWDVHYIADNSAGLRGIKVLDGPHPQQEVFDIASEDECTAAMRYQISQFAVESTLESLDNTITLRPITEFYPRSSHLLIQDKQVIPVPDQPRAVAMTLHQLTRDLGKYFEISSPSLKQEVDL
ncbi:hypothetical protein [Neptuniibacter sp. QD37_11]|uniref:hypothetical protein n=1 Tax=Neptuniibacter sp. QD37_11 TaxID=3398209 RepID=UPI0039F5FCB0